MSVLASRLRGLLKLARQRKASQQTTLGKGLIVRADYRFDRFCLWREQGEWIPGEVAEREAHACAKVLGWQNPHVYWRGRYLVVEPGNNLLVSEPAQAASQVGA